ncbi:Malic enzyme [Quillaja saponaria]|uniref:Malic enzyme n=1 Tax=Quillaja saponaria TaxID=32244 RepID=A0AAD7KLY8_QUISA|nr:Malic enzyme [Quillaja saponaria]
MFRSSSPLLRKSKPPVQVQDTIITAWTIRHPTRNRNDPIARAELYQLSYIPPSQVEACMKESDASSILFLGAAGPSWT